MQLRETLIAISDDARGWLTHWTKDFTAEEAVRRAGHVNPLAWQLGHLAVSEDHAWRLATGEAEELTSAALQAACGTGCPRPTDATVYPPIADLWGLLGRTHARVVELARRTSDADFDRKAATKNPYFHTIGQTIYELALHENYHVGEIGVLRRELGKAPIG